MSGDSIDGLNQSIQMLDSNESGLIDLRAIAKKFVQQRLNNSSTVEDIKKLALDKLKLKLDDKETRLTVSMLLDVVDILDKSSKEDINTIIKAQSDASSNKQGDGQGSNIYYNMFFGSDNPEAQTIKPAISVKDYLIIEALVTAADTIVSNKIESK